MNSYLITNKTQNPNEFNCKFGQNVLIPPNSEIAVEKMRFTNSSSVTIDDTNNTFCLLFGQYDNEMNEPLITSPSYNFFKPELLKIKHGQYFLFSEIDEAYDSSYENGSELLFAFVDALNTSKYFLWGWSIQYKEDSNKNKIGGLKCYVKGHSVGPISWNPSCFLGGNGTISDAAKIAGTSPGYNEIVDQQDGFIFFSNFRTPLPYHSDVKTETADNPNYSFEIELPTYTTGNEDMLQFFAGYTINKEGDLDFSDKSNVQNYFPISCEMDKTSKEIVFKLIDSNKNLLQSFNTGVTYNGNDTIKITFKPVITNDITGSSAKTESKQYIILNCTDGTTTFTNYFELDESFMGYDYYFGLCSESVDLSGADPAPGIIEIYTSGIDESRFDEELSGAIGGIDKEMVGLSAYIFNKRVTKNLTLDTQTSEMIINNNLSKLTRQCNCFYLAESNDYPYYIDDDEIEINIQNETTDFNVCLNIDNLPIESHFCNPKNGLVQKRLYTMFKQVEYGETIIEEPVNLKFVKLHNKNPIDINNFQIRFSNIDGSNTNALEGQIFISLLLKENTRIRNREYKDKDILDNTEKQFQMSNKII